MGAMYAKQPNNLYCRYSTVCDVITDYNLTPDGIYAVGNLSITDVDELLGSEESEDFFSFHLWPFEYIKNELRAHKNGGDPLSKTKKMLKEMGDKDWKSFKYDNYD